MYQLWDFKSVYLLELVRYIYLNPIRARLVRGLDELGGYPYSGPLPPNYFIRNYLWSFLSRQIINLAATIGYILRGNQGRTSLDL